MLERFMHLHERGLNATDTAKDNDPALFCRVCRTIRIDARDFTIKIAEPRPGTSPIATLDEKVTLIERKLVDLIGEDRIRKNLFVGRVINDRGKELENWMALNGGLQEILVRGTREYGYRTCDGCDRIFYSSQGGRYIFPPPETNGRIYLTNLGGLLLEESSIDRASIPKSRWLGVEVLKADPNPRDGFGNLEAQVASGALPRAFPERFPSRWELAPRVED
ncbi:MAG: hypothetical protein IPN84_16305 [Sphingomonadales bacterium]|jgi:hypothetical protein|nr:hypothetical protein [Sphingomonadales bacterium]